MGNWNELFNEVKQSGTTFDIIRRRYLQELHKHTKRNIIVYYSGWLQKPMLQQHGFSEFTVNDADKNGFMACIHRLDKSKGLDLFLHTPGGDMAATESLVYYLRSMFGHDIRAIVPQMAMSAGTMIACACKSIVMGEHSSLGPIDPQYRGLPAHGIIEEFEQAKQEIARDARSIPLWQQIIARYNPTLIGECQKAIDWANQMVKEWLKSGMFSGCNDKEKRADRVVAELGDHALTKAHNRHISVKQAKDIGLKVIPLEADPDLQDLVLSVHHACIHTLHSTQAVKIIENHLGVAYIEQVTHPTSLHRSHNN